ncbi:Spo12 family [Teratosphaeria destructans]|uniref:Spo12 family n=1 Tax=Teratosphaeria destructans TaxID=418781 RepID=A0A9W7STK5_9PEZI|nr:Spo12 family [Teratosphaeria destructans]
MSALSPRDPNTQVPPQEQKPAHAGAENKTDTSFQKKLFEQKKTKNKNAGEDGPDGTYVSPSDAIMSPASQKLAGFKQRQIDKSQGGKNQTSRLLFARTPSSVSGGGDETDAGGGKDGPQ